MSFQSLDDGVGHIVVRADALLCPPLNSGASTLECVTSVDVAKVVVAAVASFPGGNSGVGHNPHSISSVRGVEGASWNNNRPCGVPFAFQLRKHIVECHLDDSSNILCKDPTGSCFFNNAEHFRPEVTVIFLASLLPGLTEWLARKSTCEEVCPSPLAAVKLPDVSDDRDAGPMSVEDSGAVVVLFAEDSGIIPGSIGCEGESSDPAEEVDVCSFILH